MMEETLEDIQRSLPRAQWSRRYHFIKDKGPEIIHNRKVKNVLRSIQVPSHRLILLDRSKYTCERLREIRKREVNFNGEIQR